MEQELKNRLGQDYKPWHLKRAVAILKRTPVFTEEKAVELVVKQVQKLRSEV